MKGGRKFNAKLKFVLTSTVYYLKSAGALGFSKSTYLIDLKSCINVNFCTGSSTVLLPSQYISFSF